jgi:hypothetical protein
MSNDQPGKGYPSIPQPKKVGGTGSSAIQPTWSDRSDWAGTKKKSDSKNDVKAVDQGATGD